MSEDSAICKDCLKFQKFGKACWVYWDRKKVCTQKITSEDQWEPK